ncbi:MAG: SDR family NAD(P)-dependent oxidoreductase, partial [Candidatus Latescibacteria bacterium]|nr:SDR family NAD(P)-dependent oxidoreductase [Candidatus Latescibacterota bacterium]
MRLKGKVAIITGAGQGIGEAIARRLAQEGAAVVIADVNLETAQIAANQITEKYRRKTLPLCVDVTNSQQVAEMVRRTMEEFGKIDILVNNAGV